jgi:Spy/CpxP family protein refolding chaperone
MRRVLAVATLAAALAAATSSAAPSVPPAAFVLAGGGWGHGVGMSQWGAFGQAKAGRDYRQILDTYYRGTEMSAAPDTLLDRVRVLVADGLATATVENVLAVFDGDGKRYPIPNGKLTVKPDLKLRAG